MEASIVGVTIGDLVGGGTIGSVLFVGASGLLAQDNTNLFWDNTNKQLGIGTTPLAAFHIVESTTGTSVVLLDKYNTSGSAAGEVQFRRARGTVGSPSAVSTNDVLAGFSAYGHDGSAFGIGGVFRFRAGSVWTASNHETFFTIFVTPNGSTVSAEAIRVTGAGLVGIGTAATLAPIAPLVVDSSVNPLAAGRGTIIVQGTANKERIEVQSIGATPAPGFQGVGARNTLASPTATQANDLICFLAGAGYDNAGTPALTTNKALIALKAQENWTTTAQGTYLTLETTPSGSTTRSEKVRITGEGSVLLAKPGALATNATDGFTYIPTCAGTPTGTPTTQTGMVAMVYDTTNNKLYVYNGAWKSILLT